MKRTGFAIMLMAIICIISACSHKLHLTKKCEQENPSISEIVSESIESLFNISKYKPEMTSGYFLQINFPAINFNFSELSFANLSDFTVNRNELNKAYRFSKITNNVFICDSMGCNTVFALEDILDNIYKDILLLTNPTYNEEFYPSFPVPFHDSLLMWTAFENIEYKHCNVIYNHDTIDVYTNSYDINFCIARINIERPLKFELKQMYKGKKLAVIKEIVLIKELSLVIYPSTVSYNVKSKKTKVKSNKPPLLISHQYPAIVGFVCKIIQ